MKIVKIGKHVIPLWLMAVILVSGIGSGVLGYYIWKTLTIPLEVKEPIEILHYPSKLSLYPGETEEFNITVQNHASVNYSVILDFHLSNTTYQTSYVTFSSQIYVVVPGQQNLSASINVASDAPAANSTLTINFSRVVYPYGLVGYWRFDEGSGNVTIDSSGNGNSGTIYGATWVTGKIGYALNFDGTDDYVSIPSFILPSVTSLTVAAWINSSLNQIGYIFYSGGGDSLLHNGERTHDGSVSGRYPNLASFSVKLQDASWWDVYSTPLTPNTWHYLVGVWTKGVSLKIYVDGVLAGENDTIPNEYLYNPGSGYITTVGGYYIPEPVSTYFNGSIDGIRIYNRALNNSEIGGLYSISP